MKVLILGGTGVIGHYLSKVLNDQKILTYVTSRRNNNISNTYTKYYYGNAKEFAFLKRIILKNKFDVIIDLLNYSTKEFKERKNFLLSMTAQYIFTSSCRVYDDSSKVINENSSRLLDTCINNRYLSTDEYALSKGRQENELFSSKFSNWTIIRPYITSGHYRLQFGPFEKEQWLYRCLDNRRIVFTKELLNKITTITYGLDVAKIIYSLVGNSMSYKEVYNITNNFSLSWNDILSIYSSTLKINNFNEINLKFVSNDDFLKCNYSKEQIIYDRIFNRKFDIKKISKFFDTKSLIHPKIFLKLSLENFLKKKKYAFISGKYNAIQDKFTKDNYNISNLSFKEILKYNIFKIKYFF